MMAKLEEYWVMALTVLLLGGPGLMDAFAQAGLPKWAHGLGLVLGLVGAYQLKQQLPFGATYTAPKDIKTPTP